MLAGDPTPARPDRARARQGAPGARRGRRRAAAAARPVRRGRHPAGPAGAGRRRLRRVRRLRVGRRDGQGPHEGAARRAPGCRSGRTPSSPRAAWATDKAAVRETVAALGYPVFVKPCRAGSSVGITKVHGPDDLDDADRAARAHDPRVVVEAMIGGREIECGVLEGLDGGAPEASVPARGRRRRRARVLRLRGQVPARRGHRARRARRPARRGGRPRCASWPARAFDALSCEGLARVDFFVSGDGGSSSTRSTRCPGSRRSRCSR